jgi:Ser/Thr protein kinase RdoA (MazF antagonist)
LPGKSKIMPIPVTCSILSASALAAVIASAYPIDGPIECAFLGPTTNDHYLVTSPGVTYVLRVYRAGRRSEAEVTGEVDALLHLRGKGAPVSYPIADGGGEYVRVLDAPEGPRPAVLFSFAPGKPRPAALSDDQLGQVFGTLLAEIHAATDDFVARSPRPPFDLDVLIDRPLASIRPFLQPRPDDWAYLMGRAAGLRSQIEQLASGLDWGFCHGDYHWWNVHFADDLAPTVFDFDLCGPGWRAYDLATVRWNARRRPDVWPEVLRAYAERRRIGEADLAAIPAFVAFREIWLMGVRAASVPSWGLLGLEERLDSGLRFLREWTEREGNR